MGDHDSICIGGLAPADLRRQIKTAIESAISGLGIVVAIDEDGTCPGDFNGTSPKNIVNRLGTNGEAPAHLGAKPGLQLYVPARPFTSGTGSLTGSNVRAANRGAISVWPAAVSRVTARW